MIRIYLKIAVRNLLKYKIQNIISIVGLAVGMLCFTICLYISRFGADIDSCFKNHERIVSLTLQDKQYETFSGTPSQLVKVLRNCNLNDIEAATAVSYNSNYTFNAPLKDGELLPYEFCSLETDTCFNHIFTPEILAGSWENAAKAQNSILMSRSTAEQIYGKIENAIGKNIFSTESRFTSPASTPETGGITYTIQAIIEDLPLNNSFSFMEPIDIIIVNDSEGLITNRVSPNITGCNTYALLAPSVTNKSFQETLEKKIPAYNMFNEDFKVHSTYLTETDHNGITILSIIISITGTLILIVAFLNFFQFLIGSFLNRMKEYSLMKLLGIGRKRLFLQLFIECTIIILSAGFILFWLFEIIGKQLNFSIPPITMTFSRPLLHLHSLQYITIIILICSITCAVITWNINRISIQSGIYGNNKRNGKKRMRNIMLGVQFFVCWIFVGSTIALVLQTSKVSNSLFGTLTKQQKHEILSVPLEYSYLPQNDRLVLIERFKQLSGVIDIMPVNSDLMDYRSNGRYKAYTDSEKKIWIDVQQVYTPLNFFTFLNMDIIEGRVRQNENEIVVDPVFKSKKFKEEVIGMELYIADKTYKVCGISEPYVHEVMDSYSTVGFAFIPYDVKNGVGQCYIKCYPGKAKEVKEAVRKICKEMLPSNIEPKITTLFDDINTGQRFERAIVKIVLCVAKLLQKSEMRKDIVIELSYKGFG